MSEKIKHSGAKLLADMIQYPKRTRADHSHREDRHRDHGLREANTRFNIYMDGDLVRDRYPNFAEIGFKAQAFIDITLSKSATETTAVKDEIEIKKKLNDIENVILVYTVFGDVDLRCKVVGIDLRDIERTTMSIRDIEGILDTTTSIILDDTDYELGREKWAQLIRKNLSIIEPGLPKSYDDLSSDDASETQDI